MVVILEDSEYDAWLNAAPEDSLEFMRPFPATMMKVDGSSAYA